MSAPTVHYLKDNTAQPPFVALCRGWVPPTPGTMSWHTRNLDEVTCQRCKELASEKPPHEDRLPPMIAAHKHDCADCILLGGTADVGRVYDLYFHPGDDPTVVARYGSDGPDYYSGLRSAGNSKVLALAAWRAVIDGHLNVTRTTP